MKVNRMNLGQVACLTTLEHNSFVIETCKREENSTIFPRNRFTQRLLPRPGTRRVLHVPLINLKRICSNVQVQPMTLPAMAVADRVEVAGTLNSKKAKRHVPITVVYSRPIDSLRGIRSPPPPQRLEYRVPLNASACLSNSQHAGSIVQGPNNILIKSKVL